MRDKKAHGAANVVMNKADVFLFISPVPVLLGDMNAFINANAAVTHPESLVPFKRPTLLHDERKSVERPSFNRASSCELRV